MEFEKELPSGKSDHGLYIKLQLVEIQDGGDRHLGFTKMSVTFERLERFRPNLLPWFPLLFFI